MPSWFRRPILSLLVLLACLGMPTLALAHAALNSAVPADGSVLAAAPGRIELVFSEPVSPLALRLVGPDGAARTLDRFVLKDSTLVISPPAGLANGTYALSWRVVSEDGHPVGGALVFSIGALLSHGYVSVGFVAALGFANAMMWPAIFPLAIKGLGRFTEIGSALLVMGIAGGAIIPQLFAVLKQHYDFQAVFAALMVPCYLYILYYALRGHRAGMPAQG